MVSLYVATPLYNGQIGVMYLRGALDVQRAFPGAQFVDEVGTYLAINRQILTERFLASSASHLLFVDSDIGWNAKNVQALLDADVDMVSGVYLQRNGERIIPAEPIGGKDPERPELIECYMVPAGFLLLRRAMLERMTQAYAGLPLWSMNYTAERGYVGEDVHFSRQWRAIGGRIWLQPKAIVDHVGEAVCKMQPDEVPPVRFKA